MSSQNGKGMRPRLGYNLAAYRDGWESIDWSRSRQEAAALPDEVDPKPSAIREAFPGRK